MFALPERRTVWRFLLKLATVLFVLFMVLVIYLDATVRYRFREGQWQEPAKVFARPLTLIEGALLSREDFEFELRSLGYRLGDRWDKPGLIRRQGNTYFIYQRAQRFTGGAPGQKAIVSISDDRIASLTTATGNELSALQFEPLVIGSLHAGHREDRWLSRIEDVPTLLLSSLLLVEDRRFYEHHGVSPKAIMRAFAANTKAGQVVQGGSTLTQQLTKNVFLTRERSLWRKFKEAIMALLLEVHFSKKEILETYVNEVYLGQEGQRAIHGFTLASLHYFGKPLHELNEGQIALLVGLVKGPSYYDPWRFPERAEQRRNVILDLMFQQQWLSQADLQRFKDQPLLLAKSSPVASAYPAYLDLVKRQLRRDYSEEVLNNAGLRVYSSLDPNVQRNAETSLTTVIERFKVDQPELEGAVVVFKRNTAEIVAVVGGKKPRFAGFNRALDAVRPIGSLIKPIVYLSALERADYNLATIIADEPLEVKGHDGSIWSPNNFDDVSHGDILFYQGLVQSYNQATARLGMTVGLESVVDLLHRLGVERRVPAVPALLLGAAEMSPMEIAALYQPLASGGERSALSSINLVADNNAQPLVRYPLSRQRVIAEDTVFLLNYALTKVVSEGTARSVYRDLPQDLILAGKTGTSNDFRDSWFVGVSEDYVVTVWLGRDDNGNTGLTGSNGALRVWREFLRRQVQTSLSLQQPETIDYLWVNPLGQRSGRGCGEVVRLPFIAGREPQSSDECGERVVPKVWSWLERLFNSKK